MVKFIIRLPLEWCKFCGPMMFVRRVIREKHCCGNGLDGKSFKLKIRDNYLVLRVVNSYIDW